MAAGEIYERNEGAGGQNEKEVKKARGENRIKNRVKYLILGYKLGYKIIRQYIPLY